MYGQVKNHRKILGSIDNEFIENSRKLYSAFISQISKLKEEVFALLEETDQQWFSSLNMSLYICGSFLLTTQASKVINPLCPDID